MKEDSVKCPICLVPLVFDRIYRDNSTTKGIYECPKCGWYK